MQDVIVGLLAIAVGLTFGFRGYLAMRIVIPIWGAFGGFALGAGLVSAIAGDGFLRTAVGWIVGFVFALLFAAVAYLYYAVSVVVAMASIGFALGASVMVAFNVTWTWVVVLVGIAAGVLLAVVAIVTDLPALLLIVLSATGGASVATYGVMLLFGATDTAELTAADVVARIDDDWWWYAIYLALAIAGAFAQISAVDRLTASVRDGWDAQRLGNPATP